VQLTAPSHWQWQSLAEITPSLAELIVGILMGEYGLPLLADSVERVAPSLLPDLAPLRTDRRRWKWFMKLAARDRWKAMRIALMVRVLMLEFVLKREPLPLGDKAIDHGLIAVDDWKRLAELPATTADFMAAALIVDARAQTLAQAASRHARALLGETEHDWEYRQWRSWLARVARENPILAVKIATDAALQSTFAELCSN
jgi:hypothetical protein